MKLKIRKMQEEDAMKIAFWQYTEPYDWYNTSMDHRNVSKSFYMINTILSLVLVNKLLGSTVMEHRLKYPLEN